MAKSRVCERREKCNQVRVPKTIRPLKITKTRQNWWQSRIIFWYFFISILRRPLVQPQRLIYPFSSCSSSSSSSNSSLNEDEAEAENPLLSKWAVVVGRGLRFAARPRTITWGAAIASNSRLFLNFFSVFEAVVVHNETWSDRFIFEATSRPTSTI